MQLTVHIIPHTHDDVGWRKTYEEYFYGSNVIDNERTAVKDILNTLVDELERDPRRRLHTSSADQRTGQIFNIVLVPRRTHK